MNLLLIYTSIFFFIYKNIYADKNDNFIDKNTEKHLQKIPYSYKPSYISIGFNTFTFLHAITTCKPTKYNYDLDFRINSMIDFNRLLLDFNIGFLKSVANINSKENSLLIKINILANLIKKNSEHNSIFIGGGININGSTITIKTYDKNKKKWITFAKEEKFCWFWLNVTFGFRKSFCKKIMYFGANIVFNFFKKELFTKTKNIRSVHQEFIYAFGDIDSSLSPSFDFYIGFNIPLYTKDKRVEDNEFYFNIDK